MGKPRKTFCEFPALIQHKNRFIYLGIANREKGKSGLPSLPFRSDKIR